MNRGDGQKSGLAVATQRGLILQKQGFLQKHPLVTASLPTAKMQIEDWMS